MPALSSLVLVLAALPVSVGFVVGGYLHRHESLSLSGLLGQANDGEMIPSTIRNTGREELLVRALQGTAAMGAAAVASPRWAGAAVDDGVYRDAKGVFSLQIPPSFSTMPSKVPTPSLAEFTTEENLLSATSFAEGSSLSVTKTNAAILLKDFQIDWWFSQLDTMKDIGPPPLVATLLVLQRQGQFKKKETASEILEPQFVGKDTLTFSFVTPLAPSVQRKTIVKAVIKGNSIFTVWLSALTSVFDAEGGFGPTLLAMRESFTLL